MFFPLAWSPDGRRLFGTSVTIKDHATTGVFAYDVESRKLSELVPGLRTLGRAQRGSSLGSRFVYRDTDGIHLIDPAARSERLLLPQPPSSGYVGVACRATTCITVRVSTSADIWMRTEAEERKP